MRCVMNNGTINAKSKDELYDEIITTHYKDLLKYSIRLTSNHAVAEDILQEALIRAWTSIESLNDQTKVKSWMITIIRRENLRRIAKEKINETDNYDDFEYLVYDDFDIENTLDKEFVFKNILELKACYREPLTLQIMFGYSVEEIAEKLNLNENTVSTRLFRAKALLEKKMTQVIKVKQTI